MRVKAKPTKKKNHTLLMPKDNEDNEDNTHMTCGKFMRNLRTDDYQQLCLWLDTPVNGEPCEDMEEFLQKMLKTHNIPRYVGTIRTLHGNNEPGGRCDVFFLIHKDDVKHVAISRLQIRSNSEIVRWWEDIFYNNQENMYPSDFKNAYPPSW